MKKLPLIVLVALFSLSSCDEEEPGLPTECIQVALMDTICGQAVLQIQDPNFYYLGETANGVENVFFTYLHCNDMDKDLGGTFFIKFNPENEDEGTCVVCLAALPYDGDKSYEVRVAEDCE